MRTFGAGIAFDILSVCALCIVALDFLLFCDASWWGGTFNIFFIRGLKTTKMGLCLDKILN